HRQPAVVGNDQRLRGAQPLRQLGDDPFLVLFLHLLTSSSRIEPAHRRARRRELSSTLRSASAGLLRALVGAGGTSRFPQTPSTGPLRGRALRAASFLRRRALCGDYFYLLLQFLDDPARPLRVDVNAGAHRTGHRDLPDVPALRRRRLRAHDLIDQCGVVLDQLALAEALLADRDVDARATIRPVLELPGLGV